jgi:hypothetical protein
MPLPIDDGSPCTCNCHNMESLYHVVWKPCCPNPIQGGKLSPVWKVPQHTPQQIIMAPTQKDAENIYKEIFGEKE